MWIFRRAVSGQRSVVSGKAVRRPWSVVRCTERLLTAGVRSCPARVYGPEQRPINNGPLTTGNEPRTLAAFCFLLSAFCLLHSVASLAAYRGRYEVKEIRPHVFVWVPDDILYQVGDPQFARAGTAGFIITSEGVVVVNTTNNPFHARDLLYEIEQRTDQPIKYVINTDSRGDHMLGNEVFVDQQATIISTAVAQAEMREYQQDLTRRVKDDPRLQARMRGIHPALPTQTFDNEMTIHLGGEEIRLLDLGNGVMAGDAAVYLPAAQVLFLGDLYENGYIPRRGMTDIHGWLRILGQVEKLNAQVYVPGEGPPGDKKDLRGFEQFLEWAENEAKSAASPKNLLDPKQVEKMVRVRP